METKRRKTDRIRRIERKGERLRQKQFEENSEEMREESQNEIFQERKAQIEAFIKDPMYKPMKLKEMAVFFDIPKNRRNELKEVLDALLEEGKISVSEKGKYGKADTFAISGIFSANPKGFGFVTVEGMEQDVFISAEKMNGAFHGDKVLLVIEEEIAGKRPEGRIVRILERANETIVGFYQQNKNFGFVIPDNPKIQSDIFIPKGKEKGAMHGHKVVVRVTDFGDGLRRSPEGEVVEILGHVNNPGVDILSIVRAFGLPEEFPEEVMREAERTESGVSSKETAGRKDLRDVQMVTIDGEDAKDLDDAVSLTKKDGVYYLGVHIADVSHYVTEGSALDREALKRGTSVYLVDRVIPMLPHKLSNGICSLNAGEDRLALSCLMEIDEKGNVLGHEIAETVIRVDRRMTYTAVNAILTRTDEEAEKQRKEYQELVPMFLLMDELAKILREKRHRRGAIDFDFPETKMVLDEKGKPVSIQPYERNAATRLIEDFMLIANETVAEDFFWQEIPFLYRTHDIPDPEKMKRLGTFINNFGYTIRMSNGDIHPKEIQKLLDKIEGSPEEALISRLTLRSMKQAKYTVENAGHFGLSAKYYTHFTSPIRRYPDLQIHRIIKENLRGKLSGKRISHYDRILPEVAAQASALERRADEAERETIKLKKAEYMSRFWGQEFDGIISGVTKYGLYVELPNTVEGMIRIQDLADDYYIYNEERYELIGERFGKVYRLGQPLRVCVAGTDKVLHTVDFLPASGYQETDK